MIFQAFYTQLINNNPQNTFSSENTLTDYQQLDILVVPWQIKHETDIVYEMSFQKTCIEIIIEILEKSVVFLMWTQSLDSNE